MPTVLLRLRYYSVLSSERTTARLAFLLGQLSRGKIRAVGKSRRFVENVLLQK